MGFKVSALLVLTAIFISLEIGHAPSLEIACPTAWAVELPGLATPAQAAAKTGAVCDTSGKNEIMIACEYAEAPATTANGAPEPRIVLNRAEISFNTRAENYMRVELTFTKPSRVRVSDGPTVYLAIDNDANRNLVRRVLSHVDFTKLEPGKKLTFSDRLLIGVLPQGNYTVHLWMPNPNPALKFDSAHNLLLSNVGVPDKQAGRNTLTTFTILH
jgi:hypothetical protein